MNDHSEYLAFAREHPQLFSNEDAAITILLDEQEIKAAEAHVAAELEAKGLPSEWTRVGIMFQAQYVFLLRDAVRFSDGVLGTYSRFVGHDDSTPGVVILPMHQGNVLLTHHYRHSARQWFMELPRGFGASGLTPEENAR